MEIDNLEDLDIAGRAILKIHFNKHIGEAWTGLIWYRKRTSGKPLRMQ
jgi:hypothetical protein